MIKLKKVKPMFTGVITTCDRYTEDQKNGSIIDMNKRAGSIMEIQRVVSKGDTAMGVKEGDLVMINPARFAVMKHNSGGLKDGVITDNPVIGYNFPIMKINDVDHLALDVRDISYIIEEWEDVEPEPTLREKAGKVGIVIPSGIIS